MQAPPQQISLAAHELVQVVPSSQVWQGRQ
jgi:hypothetical protein